jgi:hypothetical protein
MKKKSLVVAVLLLFVQTNLLALDTLYLNIPTFARTRLQFNNNTPIIAQGKIALNGPNWILKITNPTGAKITLSNLEGQGEPVILTGENNAFEIKNNLLTAKNFTLNKNVRLRIDEAGGTGVKRFDIEIGKAAASDPVVPNPNVAHGGADGGEGLVSEYFPGSMVYDAIALADDNTNINLKVQILTYYAAGSTIDSAFKNNKFLQKLLGEIQQFTGAQSGGGLSSILASVGGLDVTKYADGIAKFLVKRVKQELSVAFFEKFKAIIDSTKDIRTVFPKTAILLDAIDVEVYNYERYIQNLREAFKADIVVIHRNLPGIVKNHREFFEREKELRAALLSGCYIAGELENQAHPGDILANYPIEFLDGLSLDFSGAVQTIQVLSASFRDTTTSEEAHYWVPIKSLRQLVNNKLSLKYYLGLVYHEAKTKYNSVPFKNANLVSLLDKVADKYDTAVAIYGAYKRYVLRFAEKTDALNKMIQDYSELPADSAALEKYGMYLRSAVDLIQYCTQVSTLPIIDQDVPDLDSLFSKYFQIAYSTSDLLTNISKKNYSAAINDVVRIYNLVRVKPLQDKPTDENKKAASVSVLTQNRLAKYGSFMANVATAKTPDEVAKAIEAAALPVGSSRIKRETVFNVAVNAYVGPYVGYEKIRGVDSGKINAYGITAPIGVSISKGYSILFFNSKKHRTSSSIFFSLLDLGAITAFRFTNDSTEKVPTIELKDIFSPGIFYSHGFGKTPLSLNIGYQVGPLLRKVNLDENLVGKSYSRISVSIVVDIPVFNLYSRSKL